MIKFKIYRGLCVIFGARSFVKKGTGENSYPLVKGYSRTVAKTLIAQGFTEEWPGGNR